LVAQVCKPRYSGGRYKPRYSEQGDSACKLTWANSSPDPISKNRITQLSRCRP
jgi:hypothetical protein